MTRGQYLYSKFGAKDIYIYIYTYIYTYIYIYIYIYVHIYIYTYIYIYKYTQDTLCVTEWLQYSFRKSCIQELLSVTFSFYGNIDLDQTYGVRAVFSWTFDWNLMGSGKTDLWLILKNLPLSEIYTNL